MFYDIFFINLYSFFNQLGLLCLCQKVKKKRVQQWDEKQQLLKPSAMWDKECVSRKFAVRRKDCRECLFYVPNYVKCFIK